MSLCLLTSSATVRVLHEGSIVQLHGLGADSRYAMDLVMPGELQEVGLRAPSMDPARAPLGRKLTSSGASDWFVNSRMLFLISVANLFGSPFPCKPSFAGSGTHLPQAETAEKLRESLIACHCANTPMRVNPDLCLKPIHPGLLCHSQRPAQLRFCESCLTTICMLPTPWSTLRTSHTNLHTKKPPGWPSSSEPC